MTLGTRSLPILHFGTFEVDLRAGELRKQGKRLKLQDQPFHVLAALLQRSGDVVTREELRKQIWPEDTFVDFDNSLNTAINKLREALGDSADNPRFIETLPRRGYRFLAPVDHDQQKKPSIIARRRKIAVAIAVAVLVAGAVAGGMFWRPWQARRLTEKRSIELADFRRSVAVLGFKNLGTRPQEAWLSRALSEELSTELVAGEQLRIVPGEEVDQMKTELSLGDSESYSPKTLKRIYYVLGSDYAVVGSYFALGPESGSEVRLDVRVQDTLAGETLASISERGTEAHLPELVSRVGAVLRAKLGGAEPSPEDVVRAQASLPSTPEATRLYSDGLSKLRSFDASSARNLLERAVAAEPSYALAHSALAAAWWAMGYELRAQGEAKKAFEISGNLPREQRLLIEGRYYETLHDWSKTIDIYKALTEFFPDDLEYGLLLANAQTSASEGKDALETIAALRKLPKPGRDDARIDLAEAAAEGSLGSYQRAQEAAARAAVEGNSQERRLIVAQARYLEGRSFAFLGNHSNARAALEESKKLYASVADKGHMARVLNVLAILAWQEGDFAAAINMYRESLTTARTIGDQRDIAVALNNSALVLLQRGDFGGAERIFRELIGINRDISDRGNEALAQYNLGLILWGQGELSKARDMQEKALSTFREMGQKSNIVLVQAFLALVLMAQDDLAQARRLVEEAIAEGTELGEKRNTTLGRVVLAAVASAQKRWPEAEKLAKEAAEVSRTEKLPEFEAHARALLSRALLEQGRLDEAKREVNEASEVSQKFQDPRVRFNAEITTARVMAAAGDPTEAVNDLTAIIRDAKKTGLVVFQLEGRLTLGDIEMKSGNTTAARAVLRALEKDARARGFGLIARQAIEIGRMPDNVRADHSP